MNKYSLYELAFEVCQRCHIKFKPDQLKAYQGKPICTSCLNELEEDPSTFNKSYHEIAFGKFCGCGGNHTLDKHQCRYCQQFGHWTRNCPNKKK